jgi:hypothetical protein
MGNTTATTFAVAAVAASGCSGGGADRRASCPDLRIEPSQTNDYVKAFVCDEPRTFVLVYQGDEDITAEETKDASIGLAVEQGQGDAILDDGPIWVKISTQMMR